MNRKKNLVDFQSSYQNLSTRFANPPILLLLFKKKVAPNKKSWQKSTLGPVSISVIIDILAGEIREEGMFGIKWKVIKIPSPIKKNQGHLTPLAEISVLSHFSGKFLLRKEIASMFGIKWELTNIQFNPSKIRYFYFSYSFLCLVSKNYYTIKFRFG